MWYETPEWCVDESHVTYAEFGEVFLRQHCNGCHGSESDNRHGAPTSVSFDSIEAVWTWKDAILRVTTSENASMPRRGWMLVTWNYYRFGWSVVPN